jgi:hypothetical protein
MIKTVLLVTDSRREFKDSDLLYVCILLILFIRSVIHLVLKILAPINKITVYITETDSQSLSHSSFQYYKILQTYLNHNLFRHQNLCFIYR